MTDQQELDALSESVAKIIGWTPVEGFTGTWKDHKNGCFRNDAYFAENWELMPEMLAWLCECFPDADVVLSQNNLSRECEASVWPKLAWPRTNKADSNSVIVKEGNTLPEAVSRLIIAVVDKNHKEN